MAEARMACCLRSLWVRPMSGTVGSVAVCKHGGLRRKCEICERDARIIELETALSELVYSAEAMAEHANLNISDKSIKAARKALKP